MRKLLIALALFLVLPAYANAAIAFDAVSGAKDNSGLVTSLTFSHTVSGSERMLIVPVSVSQAGAGTVTVTGVTYDGVSATLATTTTTNVNDQVAGYLYYLVAPNTGTHDVVVSLSAAISTGNKQFAANAQSYTGVSQTAPTVFGSFSDYTTATNVSASASVSNADAWLVGLGTEDAGEIAAGAAGAGTTYRGAAQFNMYGADSNGPVGTGTKSLNWGRPGATIGDVVVDILVLNPAGASASTFSPWQFSDF